MPIQVSYEENNQQNKSQVRALLTNIHLEYEAAHRGLHDIADGASRHDYITKRMERVLTYHEQLEKLVGPQAIALIASSLEQRDFK